MRFLSAATNALLLAVAASALPLDSAPTTTKPIELEANLARDLQARIPWPQMNKVEAFLILGLDHYRVINNLAMKPGAAAWDQAADWVKNNYATHVSAAEWSAAIYAFMAHHTGHKFFPHTDEVGQANAVI